jgi:hypothetical protein
MHGKPMFIRKRLQALVSGLNRESREYPPTGWKFRRMMLRLSSLTHTSGVGA